MVNTTANPIKEYYIAYFDLLGYKEYFTNNPSKVSEFLDTINTAINKTKNYIQSINNSIIAQNVANLNIHTKIFSDNILLCTEVENGSYEKGKILSFMTVVSEIQRGFILQCGLFLRGGIVKGELSFNQDFIYGQGLIDAVELEGKTVYPRIAISKEIVSYLCNIQLYTQEEANRANQIEEASKMGEEINPKNYQFYQEMLAKANKEQLCLKWVNTITYKWNDGEFLLSYLSHVKLDDFIDSETLNQIKGYLNEILPDEQKEILNQVASNDDVLNELKLHRMQIETKLKQYGRYDDINSDNFKEAELRERILKKYVWVMAYHNDMCRLYNLKNEIILTTCNCDRRFMRMTIEVITDETGI